MAWPKLCHASHTHTTYVKQSAYTHHVKLCHSQGYVKHHTLTPPTLNSRHARTHHVKLCHGQNYTMTYASVRNLHTVPYLRLEISVIIAHVVSRDILLCRQNSMWPKDTINWIDRKLRYSTISLAHQINYMFLILHSCSILLFYG